MPAGTATVATILVSTLALVLLIALRQLLARATARKLHTYQTTVVDKTTDNTIAYVGVFIPIETQYLVVEGRKKVKVDKTAFRATRIGDNVTVSEYSDGSHRLETRTPHYEIGLIGNKRTGHHLSKEQKEGLELTPPIGPWRLFHAFLITCPKHRRWPDSLTSLL